MFNITQIIADFHQHIKRNCLDGYYCLLFQITNINCQRCQNTLTYPIRKTLQGMRSVMKCAIIGCQQLITVFVVDVNSTPIEVNTLKDIFRENLVAPALSSCWEAINQTSNTIICTVWIQIIIRRLCSFAQTCVNLVPHHNCIL